MTFISYAQNYEDVTLFRALNFLDKGFYIDVGAQDPIADSVTKAFYERGWRGINIDPVRHWVDKLILDRPNDYNLNVAASAETGTLKFHEVVDTGLSTVNADLAARHVEAGFVVRETEVPARRLDEICDELGVKDIHFLKIDVEGAERAVLAGINLTRIRPWIILVEATMPNSTELNHEQWEGLLTGRGYEFVYFDGLNRFYVTREQKPHLKEALSTPPNHFDHFIRYSEWWTKGHALRIQAEATKALSQIESLRESLSAAQERVINAEGELVRDRAQLQQLQGEIARLGVDNGLLRESASTAQKRTAHAENERVQARAEVQLLTSQLSGIYRSKSWRLTMPLRKAKLFLKRSVSRIKIGVFILTVLLKHAKRRMLIFFITFIRTRPKFKAQIAHFLSYFPILDGRIRKLSRSNSWSELELLPTKHIDPIITQHLNDMRYDSNCLGPFVSQLKAGHRTIYYYVDHTILCPVNTGMQRVVRRLARALQEQGEQVRFIKWDAEYQQLILLNQIDLSSFSQWHGPSLSVIDLENYPKNDNSPVFIGKRPIEEGHWLIVPEVTHITNHSQPVTQKIVMSARRLGLRTAFIYFDAIPLRRLELLSMAPSHGIYMKHLLLADLVAPISNWAAKDLVSFFHVYEGAKLTPTPTIVRIALPGESQSTPRVTVPSPLGNSRKFILSVGSIEQRKNQTTLVRAFEKFCINYPDTDWELVLVGSVHPDVYKDIQLVVKRNARISFLDHVSDGELDGLYRSCVFTVFPSVEEGFGLPILESLWYAKPCICADFGAMSEVAEGGGCLTVNVRETEELVHAISRIAMESGLLESLSIEATERQIGTWKEYAKRLTERIDHETNPINRLGMVYYWVDHTCSYSANSGIQRVVRGLARALLEIEVKLIPVKWDRATNRLCSPTDAELQHLSQWNGPEISQWIPWIKPSQSAARDWLLIPELVSDPDGPDVKTIKNFASSHGLRGSCIFYDSIPWKMQEIYPPEATLAHQRYMEGLNELEKVFAISEQSRTDLMGFLMQNRMRTPNLDNRIQACLLPGEFLETSRITTTKTDSGAVIKVLCVCTIEPRKNHLGLLKAYVQVVAQTSKTIELVMVGSCPFPDLATQVNQYISTTSGIFWEQNVSDSRLRDLYAECDFTIYPSLEEGFGLPILESLWNARPCICRNSGAMAEVSNGGGCLTVETSNPAMLAEAMLKLIEDDTLRLQLAHEATTRKYKTWRDYAREVATCLTTERYIPTLQSLPEVLDRDMFYEQFVNIRSRPMLSICITTFNRAEWLGLSLKNLTRSMPNPGTEVEIIVCDNASTDHTPDVVKSYLYRSDFHYYRNSENVGMLGNLRVTVDHANGQYIWMLGNDDLVKPGSVERISRIIKAYPKIALVYLNYAYTHQDNAQAVTDLDQFLEESTPVVFPGPDIVGPVKQISTMSENFFTAIYCLVFRRDHALRAYSQNTDGHPFSTMLTCIPTTNYVLNFMMDEPSCWVGDPQVVVNLNVSWVKYAAIWILERLPEAYDLAEKMGASPKEVDRCRINHLPHIMHWFRVIFEKGQESNLDCFSTLRLVARMKHLDEFEKNIKLLKKIYNDAYSQGRIRDGIPSSLVFAAFEKSQL